MIKPSPRVGGLTAWPAIAAALCGLWLVAEAGLAATNGPMGVATNSAPGSNDVTTTTATMEPETWPRVLSDEAAAAGIAENLAELEGPGTRQNLIALARRTFTKKDDPQFVADPALTRVANAVAAFYLHYPTRAECETLSASCIELMVQTNLADSVVLAVEGSLYIFANELIMADLGYLRHGRYWVTPEAMGEITARLAARERYITNRVAQKPAESAAPSANNTAASGQAEIGQQDTRLAPVSPPTIRRKIRRLGESLDGVTGLKRPSRRIRELGECFKPGGMDHLQRPDTPIRRIGESLPMPERAP